MRGRIWLVATLATLAMAGTAHGTTFTVDSTGDEPDAAFDDTCATAAGVCTLRAAVEEAVDNGEYDHIVFDLATPATIQLGSPLPTLKHLQILGPGASALTVERASEEPFPVFTTASYDSALLLISGLTVTGGDALGAPAGGIAALGDLTVEDVTVEGNRVVGPFLLAETTAGGIGVTHGDLTLRRSTVRNNTVEPGASPSGGFAGGGISVTCIGCAELPQVEIVESTITGNGVTGASPTTAMAGGVITSWAHADIVNSTISGNSATGESVYGGGIVHAAGDLRLTGATVASNTSATGANVLAVTVEDPEGGSGGAPIPDTTPSVRNTLIAEPGGGGENCAVATVEAGYPEPAAAVPGLGGSAGFNLADDSSCGLDQPSDEVVEDAGLLPLADNGGPRRPAPCARRARRSTPAAAPRSPTPTRRSPPTSGAWAGRSTALPARRTAATSPTSARSSCRTARTRSWAR